MTSGKILVIRGGAIGDFILTLPVLAALRQHFPQARLEVLGYSHIAKLALTGGLADHVQSIEARSLAGFFARGGNLAEELVNYFDSFAVIISYLYDPDGIFQINVARCTPAQFIVGPHRPDDYAGIPASEVFLKPLERLAIFDADPVPRLSISHQPSTINQLVLHPGSGSEKKNWPESKWAELLRHLIRTTELNPLLVGGEAEEGKLERLAATCPATRPVDVARNLPLPELAQRLCACAAFIGHDSGISHLAAAVGLPVLLLWGETVGSVWRPLGGNVTVITDPAGLSGIPVHGVTERCREMLKVAERR